MNPVVEKFGKGDTQRVCFPPQCVSVFPPQCVATGFTLVGQAGHAKGLHWASAAMDKADSKAAATHSPNPYVRCATCVRMRGCGCGCGCAGAGACAVARTRQVVGHVRKRIPRVCLDGPAGGPVRESDAHPGVAQAWCKWAVEALHINARCEA
jgi:hypothetical protein